MGVDFFYVSKVRLINAGGLIDLDVPTGNPLIKAHVYLIKYRVFSDSASSSSAQENGLPEGRLTWCSKVASVKNAMQSLKAYTLCDAV